MQTQTHKHTYDILPRQWRGGGHSRCVLRQQLGCFLVCRTWSLHTYTGPPGRGGACSTACDTGSAGSERRGTKGGRDKRDRDGRERPGMKDREKEREENLAVFLSFPFSPLFFGRFRPKAIFYRDDAIAGMLDFRGTEISKTTTERACGWRP